MKYFMVIYRVRWVITLMRVLRKASQTGYCVDASSSKTSRTGFFANMSREKPVKRVSASYLKPVGRGFSLMRAVKTSQTG